MSRQQLLIAVIHGLAFAVVGQLHGLHEAGEADLEQLLLVQLAFGQRVPQLAVDLVVGIISGLVVGQLVLGEHIGQGLALSRIKVQQSVVNVQKDASVNGHFKMTLLFLVY